MNYTTRADVLAEMFSSTPAGPPTNAARDAVLDAIIEEASAFIDEYTGRKFEATNVTITLVGDGGATLDLPAEYDPLISIASVVVGGATLNPASYFRQGQSLRLSPTYVNSAWGIGYRWPDGWPVTISLSYGYTTVPLIIRRAAKMLTRRWWEESKGGYADSQGGGDGASREYRRKIDPEVEFMLAPYRRTSASIGIGIV